MNWSAAAITALSIFASDAILFPLAGKGLERSRFYRNDAFCQNVTELRYSPEKTGFCFDANTRTAARLSFVRALRSKARASASKGMFSPWRDASAISDLA